MRGGLGLYLICGVALGLVLLAVLGAVLAGRMPWSALPGAWLGGSALILLLAIYPSRPAGGRRATLLAHEAHLAY